MLDIIARDSNDVHADLGLIKATMTLIEEHQLDTFYEAMGPTIQMSGGSVANSIAGVAALGGTCGYIGQVADDEFGERFTHDLSSMGVDLDLAIAGSDEGATGRCHVFITDDAQRTMATYLGASNQLRVSDINERLIARSEITYVEGYLYDLAPAKEAIQRVVDFAHVHDSMVALSLSSPAEHAAPTWRRCPGSSRYRPVKSTTSSTRTVPVTCSPRASSTVWPWAPIRSKPLSSARGAPARSSSTWAHAWRATSKNSPSRPDCSSSDALSVEDGVEFSGLHGLPTHPRDGDRYAGEQHQCVATDPHDRPSEVNVGEY